MMILWHDLLQSRPCYPIPSIHHQTLLSKAIFEHCLDYSQVASIALASKSIQNSSLSPNFAFNVVIDEQSVKLFETVFHPSTSLPVQFVPAMKILYDSHPRAEFVASFISTKYFHKSLKQLTIGSTRSSSAAVAAGVLGEFMIKNKAFQDFVNTENEAELLLIFAFTNLHTLTVESLKHVSPLDITIINKFLSAALVTVIVDATRNSFAVSEKLDTFVAEHISRLEKLAEFSLFGDNLTPGGLTQFAKAMTTSSLRTLCCQWAGKGITDACLKEIIPLIVESQKNLSRLDFSDCYDLSDASMKNIAPVLGTLTSLRISGSSKISDRGISSLFARNLEPITDAPSLFPRLRELNFGGSDAVTDLSLEIISTACPNLELLYIWWGFKITDRSFEFIATSEHTLSFKNSLSSLTVLQGSRLTGIGLEFISSSFTKLEHLCISNMNSDNINNVGLAHDDCTALKTLINSPLRETLKELLLEGRAGLPFPTEGVLPSTQPLFGVTTLDFSSREFESGQICDSLPEMLRVFPNLTLLNLMCSEKLVDDAGLLSIATSLCSSLVELNVAGCINITNVGVDAVLKNLVRLRVLYLNDCRFVSDDAFFAGSPPKPRPELRRLCSLVMYGCYSLSSEAVESIRQSNPRLRLDWDGTSYSAADVGEEEVEAVSRRDAKIIFFWVVLLVGSFVTVTHFVEKTVQQSLSDFVSYLPNFA